MIRDVAGGGGGGGGGSSGEIGEKNREDGEG